MAQYKVVPGPKRVSIGHDGSLQEALNQVQKTIESESSGGWELVCSHEVRVTQDPEPLGCLGQVLVVFGAMPKPRGDEYHIDMLIFVKKER